MHFRYEYYVSKGGKLSAKYVDHGELLPGSDDLPNNPHDRVPKESTDLQEPRFEWIAKETVGGSPRAAGDVDRAAVEPYWPYRGRRTVAILFRDLLDLEDRGFSSGEEQLSEPAIQLVDFV